jgi:chaperonin GroES
MKIVPLNDYLVLKQEEAMKMTKSGIILPDEAQRPPSRGTVLAAGPGKLRDDDKRAPMDVAVGDLVLYTSFAGHPIDLEGDKFLMLRADDVIGKVVK